MNPTNKKLYELTWELDNNLIGHFYNLLETPHLQILEAKMRHRSDWWSEHIEESFLNEIKNYTL